MKATARSRLDLSRCERLAERASRGDERAWKELVALLWPALGVAVREDRSMGSRGRSDDEVHDVLTRLFEKLGAGGGRGLRLYFTWRERHPGKSFEDWLRIVTKNVVRDHLRGKLGPRTGTDEPSVKRLLNEFATSPVLEKIGVRPPMTAAQTARQLLEFARARLPAEQFAALTAWLDGASFEEIGAERGDGGAEDSGRKLVRAAVATIRRHFVAPE